MRWNSLFKILVTALNIIVFVLFAGLMGFLVGVADIGRTESDVYRLLGMLLPAIGIVNIAFVHVITIPMSLPKWKLVMAAIGVNLIGIAFGVYAELTIKEPPALAIAFVSLCTICFLACAAHTPKDDSQA